MTLTVHVESIDIEALSFHFDANGFYTGSDWKHSKETPDSFARQEIEARELERLCDSSGKLCFAKVFPIYQRATSEYKMSQIDMTKRYDARVSRAGQRPGHQWKLNPCHDDTSQCYELEPWDQDPRPVAILWAYRAWETGNGVRLTPGGPLLSQKNGDACPGKVLAWRTYEARHEKAFFNYDKEAKKSHVEEAYRLWFSWVKILLVTPTDKPADTLMKFRVYIKDLSVEYADIDKAALNMLLTEFSSVAA